MAKYVSKPLVVEAVQWQKPGDYPKVVEVIEHRTGVAISEHEKDRWRGIGTVKYALVKKTDRGLKIMEYVRPGDWIVEQNRNDYSVISNADFKANFILKE
jgi:hypothetical protein